MFCGSFQGVNFCSVVGAHRSLAGTEREEGVPSERTDVGTTASVPNSVLCRTISEDLGPGARCQNTVTG